MNVYNVGEKSSGKACYVRSFFACDECRKRRRTRKESHWWNVVEIEKKYIRVKSREQLLRLISSTMRGVMENSNINVGVNIQVVGNLITLNVSKQP